MTEPSRTPIFDALHEEWRAKYLHDLFERRDDKQEKPRDEEQPATQPHPGLPTKENPPPYRFTASRTTSRDEPRTDAIPLLPPAPNPATMSETVTEEMSGTANEQRERP